MARIGMNHRQQDLRSIAFHRAIAAKLRKNPGLIGYAFENMARWERLGYAGSTKILYDRWRKLLVEPIPILIEKLVEDSETMQQLRQATPFAGILTNEEREAIIEQTSA